MQLDNTRIVVRERNVLESMDLALHVLREFARPWFLCSLATVLPLMCINFALLRSCADNTYEDSTFIPFRYFWMMSLLIYIEAPLASSLTVAFMGPAVFMERPNLWQVFKDSLKFIPELFICHLLLRGVLAAWVVLLLTDRDYSSGTSHLDSVLIPLIALYSTAMRAFRPFINEIILLEKNRLRAGKANTVSVGVRSNYLHGPSGPDLFLRWIGAAAVGLTLVAMMVGTLYAACGVLFSFWGFNWEVNTYAFLLSNLKIHVLFPAGLWFVAAFFSIVRFLEYLDLRIRHEGWEVELLMRAEALRLTQKGMA